MKRRLHVCGVVDHTRHSVLSFVANDPCFEEYEWRRKLFQISKLPDIADVRHAFGEHKPSGTRAAVLYGAGENHLYIGFTMFGEMSIADMFAILHNIRTEFLVGTRSLHHTLEKWMTVSNIPVFQMRMADTRRRDDLFQLLQNEPQYARVTPPPSPPSSASMSLGDDDWGVPLSPASGTSNSFPPSKTRWWWCCFSRR